MGQLFRVFIGYIVACLVAGLATVLFAWTPSDLSSMPGDAANEKLALVLPVATHIALFMCVPAIVAFMFGERHRRRDWLYYALAGVAIALLGFFAQHISEDARQTWHIADSNYPLFAFICTGFLSGLAYWLVAGRHAGLRAGAPVPATGHSVPMPKPSKPGSSSGSRPNTQRT